MASGVNLFVVPLSKKVDDEILRNAFSEYGELFSAQVARDESGVSKGFGFVHFCSVNDGLRAKEEMNNKRFFDTVIQVKLAHNQEGKCIKNVAKNNAWVSDWNIGSSDVVEDTASNCDVQSEYSDGTTYESNLTGELDIKQKMKKLFESQTFTDVTFYPKDNRRVSISAHRAVLAISSPLFTKMLFDDQKGDITGMNLEVQISNLSFNAFVSIVKYIYTDEVTFEDEALVQDILDGAKQFSIYSLVNRCKEYFENMELTTENVCSKLELSISNKINSLKARCTEFIQSNTLYVIQSAAFQKCTSTTVRAICKLQFLNLHSEVELLDAVMQWLRAQSGCNKMSLLEPLLKCIRFLSLSVEEFGDTLKKYPDIMTSEEGLSIMLFLYNPPKNPTFSSVPSWCNKNMQRRCFFKEEDLHASMMNENVADPKGMLFDKVIFPLKSDPGQGFASELTSLLQMKCIGGYHIIKAIRLTFEKPLSDQCRINDLRINVHVGPSNFKDSETVQIVNSESVRVEFKRRILVRRGDVLDIEAEARNIRLYKFLHFDDTAKMPYNPHFNCFFSSIPKQKKLYFISEVEYGPQDQAARQPRRQNRCRGK